MNPTFQKASLFKRLICMALALSLLPLGLLPAVPAEAIKVSCEEYSGSNQLSETHTRWSSPITSHLVNVDTGLMRFQAEAVESGYLVEYYDSDYAVLRTLTVAAELPIYGGFYASGDNYYILSGQENLDESADVECFRITKYDLEWNRLGSVGLYDCNTTVPFDAGSARFAMSGKYLIIRTAHEMYTASDGYNHQANVTIQVDTETMTITDSYTRVMNYSYGYVSHSFNQFVHIEDNEIVAVDHGDAHPRSIVLLQYHSDMSDGTFTPGYYTKCTATELQLFSTGSSGDNDTGASVGGFEISSSSYLVAYNYVVSEENYANRTATRNVVIASMDKESGEVTLKRITDYADGDATASVPHLVKLSDERFLLLWAQGSDVCYTLLDAAGDPISGTYRMENAALSDCVPVISGDQAVWYVWNNNLVTVYEIDLTDLSKTGSTELTYGHDYQVQSYPATAGGDCTIVCQSCGDTFTGSTPSSITLCWNTSRYGSYSSRIPTTTFDVGEMIYMWAYPGATATDLYQCTVTVSDPAGATFTWHTDQIGYFTFNAPGTYTITVTCNYNPDLVRTQTVTVSHTDEDDDGVCDGCGYVEPTPTISQKGRTLSYEDSIYVLDIFELTDAEGIDLSTDAGLLIWSEEEYEAMDQIAFDADHANVGLRQYPGTDFYYGSSDAIYTRNLHENAYYVGYVKLADGSYIFSEAQLYGPSVYAHTMLNKSSTSAKTKELCVALLNYIASAQMYFYPETAEADLVNYDLTTDQKALDWTNIDLHLAPAVSEDKQVAKDAAVFTKAGKNLLFAEMISLSALFVIEDETVAGAQECGTIFWTAEEFAALEGTPGVDNYGSGTKTHLSRYQGMADTWVSHAPKIPAKDMADTEYYILGYVIDADGNVHYSGVMSYTIEQYISNKASETAMGTLAKRLYFYERAARAALKGI